MEKFLIDLKLSQRICLICGSMRVARASSTSKPARLTNWQILTFTILKSMRRSRVEACSWLSSSSSSQRRLFYSMTKLQISLVCSSAYWTSAKRSLWTMSDAHTQTCKFSCTKTIFASISIRMAASAWKILEVASLSSTSSWRATSTFRPRHRSALISTIRHVTSLNETKLHQKNQSSSLQQQPRIVPKVPLSRMLRSKPLPSTIQTLQRINRKLIRMIRRLKRMRQRWCSDLDSIF